MNEKTIQNIIKHFHLLTHFKNNFKTQFVMSIDEYSQTFQTSVIINTNFHKILSNISNIFNTFKTLQTQVVMSHDEYYQTFQTSVIIKHKLSHRNKLLNTMVETFLTIRRKNNNK
jgi:hypothetical protein